MFPDLTPYLDLGATAIVAIVGFWMFSKIKKNGNGKSQADTSEALRIETANIAKELKLQNENHLNHIENNITSGFENMRDCYEAQTTRICGKLDVLILEIGKLSGKIR